MIGLDSQAQAHRQDFPIHVIIYSICWSAKSRASWSTFLHTRMMGQRCLGTFSCRICQDLWTWKASMLFESCWSLSTAGISWQCVFQILHIYLLLEEDIFFLCFDWCRYTLQVAIEPGSSIGFCTGLSVGLESHPPWPVCKPSLPVTGDSWAIFRYLPCRYHILKSIICRKLQTVC